MLTLCLVMQSWTEMTPDLSSAIPNCKRVTMNATKNMAVSSSTISKQKRRMSLITTPTSIPIWRQALNPRCPPITMVSTKRLQAAYTGLRRDRVWCILCGHTTKGSIDLCANECIICNECAVKHGSRVDGPGGEFKSEAIRWNLEWV